MVRVCKSSLRAYMGANGTRWAGRDDDGTAGGCADDGLRCCARRLSPDAGNSASAARGTTSTRGTGRAARQRTPLRTSRLRWTMGCLTETERRAHNWACSLGGTAAPVCAGSAAQLQRSANAGAALSVASDARPPHTVLLPYSPARLQLPLHGGVDAVLAPLSRPTSRPSPPCGLRA